MARSEAMSATTTGGSDGDGAAGQLQDVWQVLELAAIHHADRLAVVDCAAGSGRQLTYAQLFERAAALAAHMRGAGVRRGDRIAILSRNSSHVIELHFAAAAIHAVVVNLNIHLAPCELAFICADAAPKLVFADVHCAPALLAAHASVLQSRAAVDQAVAATAPPPLFDSVVWMLVEGGAEVPAGGEGVQVGQHLQGHAAFRAIHFSQCCQMREPKLCRNRSMSKAGTDLPPCRHSSTRHAWRALLLAAALAPSWRVFAPRCSQMAARRMVSTCTTPAVPQAYPRACCSATASLCTMQSGPSKVRWGWRGRRWLAGLAPWRQCAPAGALHATSFTTPFILEPACRPSISSPSHASTSLAPQR